MLTVVHKERKKEEEKERKDYGYYTLIIYKNGLDKADHLTLHADVNFHPSTDSPQSVDTHTVVPS
jgi:hypothetical protein